MQGIVRRRTLRPSPIFEKPARREQGKNRMRIQHPLRIVLAFLGLIVMPLAADEVTDWNKIMFQAALGQPATPAPVMARNAAMVQAAVFDAVNGIERRYTHIRV